MPGVASTHTPESPPCLSVGCGSVDGCWKARAGSAGALCVSPRCCKMCSGKVKLVQLANHKVFSCASLHPNCCRSIEPVLPPNGCFNPTVVYSCATVCNTCHCCQRSWVLLFTFGLAADVVRKRWGSPVRNCSPAALKQFLLRAGGTWRATRARLQAPMPSPVCPVSMSPYGVLRLVLHCKP